MIQDDSDYIVSLFQFGEDADFQEFFDYCDGAANLLSEYPGFRSAFGYLSTFELAKFRYVGVTQLDSFDVLYEAIESHPLSVRLTPPENISAMTQFAKCRTMGYPDIGMEHRNTTQSSVTFINAFSQGVHDRDSEMNLELERRNLMLARSNQHFLGYKGYASTIPSALYNYVAFAEYADEAAFLEHMDSELVRAANKGYESINNSGYPGIYKLVLAKTDDGFEIDTRAREMI